MNSREVLKTCIKKRWHEYEKFLVLIDVLEAAMVVYGLVLFDFHSLRRQLYFISYIVLIICTSVTMIINRISMKEEKHIEIAIKNACVYNVILIFWSAFVSALDISNGGYPVTYMTILAAVGSVISFSPLFYGCLAILSSAFMTALSVFEGGAGLHVPFYLNHGIFLLVIIAVEYRNYRTTREQFSLNNKLEELAGIDELTRIGNRRSLDNFIDNLINEKCYYSFALLDIDNFKTINDTFGHKEGDNCLVNLASVLKESFGNNVFRYGGDEFAVVSFEKAEIVAEEFERINEKLKEKVTQYKLQICAGVYYSESDQDERRIFEHADTALYEAKHQGKARAVVYK